MPKLPSGSSITRPSVKRASGRPSYDPTLVPNVYGQANIQAPKQEGGLGDIGEQMVQYGLEQQEKKDKYEFDKAKADWVKREIEIEQQFLNDTDYETLQERKSLTLRQAAGDIVNGISNNENRGAFAQSADMDISRSQLTTAKALKVINDERTIGAESLSINDSVIALSELDPDDVEKRSDLINGINQSYMNMLNAGARPESIGKLRIQNNKKIEEDRFRSLSKIDIKRAQNEVEISEGLFTKQEKEDIIEDIWNDEMENDLYSNPNGLLGDIEKGGRYEGAPNDLKSKYKKAAIQQLEEQESINYFQNRMASSERQIDMQERLFDKENPTTYKELRDYIRANRDDPQAMRWAKNMEKLMPGAKEDIVERSDEEKFEYRASLHGEYDRIIKKGRKASTEDMFRFNELVSQGYAEGYLKGKDGDAYKILGRNLYRRFNESVEKDGLIYDPLWGDEKARANLKEDRYFDAYDSIGEFFDTNPTIKTNANYVEVLSSAVLLLDSIDTSDKSDEEIRQMEANVITAVLRGFVDRLSPNHKGAELSNQISTTGHGTINIPTSMATKKSDRTIQAAPEGYDPSDFSIIEE